MNVQGARLRGTHPQGAHPQGMVVAIGNFDGVHKGHQQVVAETVRIAENMNAHPVALTFEPHPRRFFMPSLPPLRLTTPQQKVSLLKHYGCHDVLVLPFDDGLAQKTATQFVDDLLLGTLNVRHVVTGADFRFGKARSGDTALLSSLLKAKGVQATVVMPQNDAHGVRYAATHIRQLLQQGHIDAANAALGHPFTIRGLVQHGDARGRTLGFPTANVPLDDYVRPMLGVYAVQVHVPSGQTFKGVANVGRRPTVGGEDVRLEAHLFNFNQNIYGQLVDVELHHFIRPEMTFASLDALTAQIEKDVAAAQQALI